MAFVTLFSAPKPFTDPHIATIQGNAIRSWMLLPGVDVILLGDEPGLAEAARQLGARHFPDVARNEKGTPLVSSMLRLARENSEGELLCIINADILLLPDFIQAAREVSSQKKDFVLVSQRWDLDLTEPLSFSDDWLSGLQGMLRARGELHRPAGSDFFLFPRACYAEIPDFAIGRAGWDNWMIYKARQEKWPVIDGTPSLTVIHQNHDYRHLPGGQPHYKLPETDQNIRLAGGEAAIRYTILDATHRLENGQLVPPPLTSARRARGLEILLRKIFFFLPENMREDVVRPQRWKKRFKKLFGSHR